MCLWEVWPTLKTIFMMISDTMWFPGAYYSSKRMAIQCTSMPVAFKG